jgi:hypothetical protein
MHTETPLGIHLSVIGRCSLVPMTSHWLQGKCARINLSSGIILQNHRRLPVSIFSVKIAALWSLKRVTVRIFDNNGYVVFK